MQIHKLGIMSPGDMGQALALQLRAAGASVYTALAGRSDRSRALAREAGLVDLGSIARLAAECDAVLSVMNPAAALGFGLETAAALAANPRPLTFVDCNAIAPATVAAIGAAIVQAGGRCIDASIIGPPPRGAAKAVLYTSGPGAQALEAWQTPQLAVHYMSERIGDASALKMCYGAINKGTQALVLQALVAARSLGVDAQLEAQLSRSRADLFNWVLGSLPEIPPKAYRWAPEMLQIAQAFESVGLTPRTFQGAADVFELIAATPIGRETPENRDRSRAGRDVVRLLAEGLAPKP